MPVIVIGGIRCGLLTVTESAAVAVLYALTIVFPPITTWLPTQIK